MTTNAKIVLQGWIKLSYQEKQELLEEIDKFNDKGNLEKSRYGRILNEELRRVVGPTTQLNCPCCGR